MAIAKETLKTEVLIEGLDEASQDGRIRVIIRDAAGTVISDKKFSDIYTAITDTLAFLQTQLDVTLSTRASEATLSGIKIQTDKLQFDPSNFLRIALASDEVNIAKESTLASLTGALDSVGTDAFITYPDDPPNLDIPVSQIRDTLRHERTPPTQEYSAEVVSPSSSIVIDKRTPGPYSSLSITVRATYDAAATQGVRIRWLYSIDGANYDTVEDAEDQGNYEDLSFKEGETRQRTVNIPLITDYVRVEVVNLDTAASVTVDVWSCYVR